MSAVVTASRTPTRRDAPIEALVARPLETVDEVDHGTRRGVEQRDVRRVEPAAGERCHGERLVAAVGHAFHGRLMGGCVVWGAVPNTDHVLSGTPFFVFCETEPDDRPALRADEILARQPDGPTETGGLGDDLIKGVHRFRPADPRDRLHLLAVLEELHAERDRPQL